MDALQALVETKPWSEITVDDIAKAAGVAHGTVYRHFADRAAVLLAARLRWSAELDRYSLSFEGPVASAAAERARLRTWIQAKLKMAFERPGLVRAFAALAEESEAEANRRSERRELAMRSMSEYIRRLADAGLIAPPRDGDALSRALILTLEGVYREAAQPKYLSRHTVSEGVADLFDRAVFVSP